MSQQKVAEPHYPLVLVTWNDAAVFHGWKPIEDLTKVVTDKIQSVGFLIQENEDFIVLAMGLSENENEKVVLGTEALAIPCPWLIKVEKLGLAEGCTCEKEENCWGVLDSEDVPALEVIKGDEALDRPLTLDEHIRRGGTYASWEEEQKRRNV